MKPTKPITPRVTPISLSQPPPSSSQRKSNNNSKKAFSQPNGKTPSKVRGLPQPSASTPATTPKEGSGNSTILLSEKSQTSPTSVASHFSLVETDHSLLQSDDDVSPTNHSPSLPQEDTSDATNPLITLQGLITLIPILLEKFDKTVETLLAKKSGTTNAGKLMASDVRNSLAEISPELTKVIQEINYSEQQHNTREEDLLMTMDDMRSREASLEEHLHKMQSSRIQSQTQNQESSLNKKQDHLQKTDIQNIQEQLRALTREVALIRGNNQQQPSTASDIDSTNKTNQASSDPQDFGVVLLAPAKQDPSWSAKVKTILNKMNLEDNEVTIRDSRRGQIIIRGTESTAPHKIKEMISKNQDILQSTTLSCRDPILTTMVVKALPSSTTPEAVLQSLKELGSRSAKLGRTYSYAKSDSFTQIIQLESSLARKLLSSSNPQIKVNLCHHPVQLFVPYTRCRNCQLIGHSTSECRLRTTVCGFCAKSGHISSECRARDDEEKHYCINCHEHNEQHPPNEHMEPYHASSSKFCPTFKNYITYQITNSRKNLFKSKRSY